MAEEATEEPGDKGEEEVAGLNFVNLTIETEVTQQEAKEELEAALKMEVEGYMGSEGKEGGEELKGFQCLLSPSTPFLTLAPPISYHLHLLSYQSRL